MKYFGVISIVIGIIMIVVGAFLQFGLVITGLTMILIGILFIIIKLTCIAFRNSKKIDKGYEFYYWHLSYRRKFIRTIWMIPFIVGATLLLWMTYNSLILTLICFIVMAMAEIIQAIYTYQKWKNGGDL